MNYWLTLNDYNEYVWIIINIHAVGIDSKKYIWNDKHELIII